MLGTFVQIAFIGVVVAVAAKCLKKADPDSPVLDSIREWAGRLMEKPVGQIIVPEDTEERQALGLYILNVLDEGQRTCFGLGDLRLENGYGIRIGAEQVNVSNRHIKQEIAIGAYTNRASELRGENPILVFRDGKSGELFVRFDAQNVCYVQHKGNKPEKFDSTKCFKMKDISRYGEEDIFYISGVPVAFSLNPVYAGRDGEWKTCKLQHDGQSFILREDMPQKNANNNAPFSL